MALMVTDDQIIDFIKKYQEKNGWAPTVREIAKGVGYASTSTMQDRLVRLSDSDRIVYKGVRQIRVVG